MGKISDKNFNKGSAIKQSKKKRGELIRNILAAEHGASAGVEVIILAAVAGKGELSIHVKALKETRKTCRKLRDHLILQLERKTTQEEVVKQTVEELNKTLLMQTVILENIRKCFI